MTSRTQESATVAPRAMLFIALVVIITAARGADAATYYVRTGGNDSASGLSSALAWKTIAKAAGVASAGDTVYVGAGTYNESITFTRSGTAGNPIRFIADTSGAQTGNAGTVNATHGWLVVWTLNAANYVTIDGFTFPGGNTALTIIGSSNVIVQNCSVTGSSTHSIIINSASAVAVSGCTVYSNSNRGIYLNGAGNCSITACTIRNNSTSGIYAEASSATLLISRCTLYSNSNSGVQFHGANGQVVNCLIRNHPVSGVYADSSNTGKTVQVVNCSINTMSTNGVHVDAGTMTVMNSIIANSSANGMKCSGGTLTHSYNLVYSSGGGNFSGTVIGTGELTSNPQFTSSTDLHLVSGSPALNAGTDASAFTSIDLDGNTRPSGGGWDMGCYEAVGGLFTDVSTAAGFDVQTASNVDLGSGLHWADVDNDGDLDAIITGTNSKIMMNNGNGTFSASAFGGGSVRCQGALGDFDNDGDIDFWAACVGDVNSERLMSNIGFGVFSNLGDTGLTGPSNNEAAATADINWDGFCDVVMFSENKNYLGVNQGSSTVALSPSFAAVYGFNESGDSGNGDYCSSGDVNDDGRTDFFFHYGTGKLFLSEGDGTYLENAGGISIVTGESVKIGSAWADYDNDGDLDLFVPNRAVGSTSYLWKNTGGAFTNVAATAGLTDSGSHRSACWGDYDNDGDLDLYIVTTAGGNLLYRNNGGGTFTLVSENAAATGDNHDAVFVDYDKDGDLDLAVTRQGTTNVLLRNGTNNSNYLRVRVVGHGNGATNMAGIGVRVELYNAAGTTLLQRRDVGAARGFGGTEPLWVHFGGVTPSTAYMVKVYFVSCTMSVAVTPNSASTVVGSTTLNQTLTVTEPAPAMKMIGWTEVDPVNH